MLKVENLKVRYGMIEAIKGISFEVRDGEIVTLIGANGAGKTTTMHAISGLIKAAEGTISLDGTELTKIPPHKIVGLGLAQVPEGRRVFAQQTVEENLILGAYLRRDQGEIAKDIQDVYQTLPAHFPAASSRCSLWDALSWPSLPSCCWTSPPWASPPSLSRKSSRS